MRDNPDYDPWSVRQTAVYQQYNSAQDKTTFLLIAPSDEAKANFEEEVLRLRGNQKRLNPFHLHLILVATMHENWRLYLRSLEHVLMKQVSDALSCCIVGWYGDSENLVKSGYTCPNPKRHLIRLICGFHWPTAIKVGRRQNTWSSYHLRVTLQHSLEVTSAVPETLHGQKLHRLQLCGYTWKFRVSNARCAVPSEEGRCVVQKSPKYSQSSAYWASTFESFISLTSLSALWFTWIRERPYRASKWESTYCTSERS
jgi:hypothetical protein